MYVLLEALSPTMQELQEGRAPGFGTGGITAGLGQGWEGEHCLQLCPLGGFPFPRVFTAMHYQAHFGGGQHVVLTRLGTSPGTFTLLSIGCKDPFPWRLCS